MLNRFVLVTFAFAAAAPAVAQPVVAVEGLAGYGAFVDETAIGHGVVGSAVRIHVAPRHSIGPEVIYMRGPAGDRAWFVTANYTFDVVPQGEPLARRRVNPFVVAGVGFMRYEDRFFAGTFTSNEGAFTGGGGARVWLADRVYALGEVRMGWELHVRVNGGVGMTWD